MTVEMARCFHLDIQLRLGGLVLVGWLSLCIWRVGELVARPCRHHGEVVACVACRLGVASVVGVVVVLVN